MDMAITIMLVFFGGAVLSLQAQLTQRERELLDELNRLETQLRRLEVQGE